MSKLLVTVNTSCSRILPVENASDPKVILPAPSPKDTRGKGLPYRIPVIINSRVTYY